jgi:hypothetical protein
MNVQRRRALKHRDLDSVLGKVDADLVRVRRRRRKGRKQDRLACSLVHSERKLAGGTSIMTTCASSNDQGLLAPPGRSGTMSRGMNDLAAESVLPREGCWHLGLPASEAGGEDDMRDGHIPSSLLAVDLANDSDLPLLRRFVELGASRIERCLAPAVNLQDINVGFEEVGELAGGSKDRPLEEGSGGRKGRSGTKGIV